MYRVLKKQLISTAAALQQKRLTVGTWGNISLRIDGRHIAISPSGIRFDLMKPSDISIVDIGGNRLEGKKPSVETPTHLALYKYRADIGCVIHTHSIHTTALSVLGLSLPPLCEDMVQLVGGEILCSDYALPGTEDLAVNVVRGIGGNNAVMLPNHGAVCVGKDAGEAMTVCEVLEKSAEIYLLVLGKGELKLISNRDIEIMREFIQTRYGQR